ncbi:Ger(x)C family spore germination protein [Paenibacillus mesophilus]|uniref:Ger(x)C family spore germination protein n=1 Tax=Paenibacillus mesophilus TaxID=2582849 RepID=UPI00110F48F5|nr:Ger(x)C family spore germination protein [Paenibacillus mesophilus]TMV51601.1 Ger(x)C family spore germination protein [Paenibacillus mesophilus]
MRNIAACVAAILICGMLSGCWNRIELNELSITSATAFDVEGDEWVVTYQIVTPSAIASGMGITGGGTSQSPVSVFSTRGRTIREAVNQGALENPRWLFFSHTNILVVSEKVARKGLGQILDLFYRNPDNRETVNVLITAGNPRTILEQLMHTEKIPGLGIRNVIFNESRNASMLPSVMMYELAMALTGDARSAVIPEIVVAGGKPESSLDELKKTYHSSKVRIGRLAVLHDEKFVGWLTKEESLGVSFIANKVNATAIAFSCKHPDGNVYNSTFRLESSSTKLKPSYSNGRFAMSVEIKGSGNLVETGCAMDLSDPKVVKGLEKQLEAEVTQTVEKSWQAVKRLKTDVVGFADAVHRKYPKAWKQVKPDWESSFVDIQIEPHVTISMNRIGLSNKSFKTPEKEEGG